MAVQRPLDLIRGLGPWAAAAIVVGTMVGTGIFIVPADMARSAGSVGLVFVVWLAGGALTLFGAFGYAELGAAIPEAGGTYAFLARGFGPVWGFLFGWVYSVIGCTASIAAIAAGLVRFWGALDPRVLAPLVAWHLPVPWAAGPATVVVTMAMPLAVAPIALVTAVNYVGVRTGGRVQVALTIVKVAVLVAVIVGGLLLAGPVVATAGPAARAGTLGGFFAALVAALWAYDGWSNLSFVGAELVEPEKNVPRTLVGGVAMVVVLYLLISAVCFRVLPFDQAAASPHIVSDVIDRLAGSRVAGWLTVAMIASALGTLNSAILSDARVPFAMARDRRFFRVARGIHPRFRTPANALVFQGALASVLALTGTFEELLSLYVFTQFIFYALATAAMMRLRRTAPELARPYRTWGYPVVPILYIAGAVAVTVSVLIDQPVRSAIGLVVTFAGLLFYRHWRDE